MEIGFIGLGDMGRPMAGRLLEAGHRLVVWNRSPARSAVLREAGAEVAGGAAEVLARCSTVFTMLADGPVLDAVLERGSPAFAARLRGRLLVNLATNSAAYATSLAAELEAAGARYVEAPVSGSQVQAERGELVAMLAGATDDCEVVAPLLAPLCRHVVRCGPVPQGTLLKFATLVVNIGMITALAEATHFAERQEVPVALLIEALLAGPLANDIIRVKGPKVLRHDYSTQAAIRNVVESNRLVVESATAAGAATPIMGTCLTMYRRALAAGFGEEDMVGVIKAYDRMARDSDP